MARVKAVVGRDARTVVLNADDPTLVALARDVRRHGRVVRAEPSRPAIALGGARRSARSHRRSSAARGRRHPDHVRRSRHLQRRERARRGRDRARARDPPERDRPGPAQLPSSTRRTTPGAATSPTSRRARAARLRPQPRRDPRRVVGFARALLAERGKRRAARHDRHARRPPRRGAPRGRGRDCRGRARASRRERLPAELLRGRAPGAVPELLAAGLRDHGVAAIEIAATELDAVKRALAGARAGDVVLVLTHLDPRWTRWSGVRVREWLRPSSARISGRRSMP